MNETLIWIIFAVFIVFFGMAILSSRRLVKEIATRKKIQNALYESEERFRSLADNVSGIIYRRAFDIDWHMVFISDAVYELSGYPSSDFINNSVRSYTGIIHPDDQVMVSKTVEQKLKQRQPFEIKYRILNKDGGVRWVFERGVGLGEAKSQKKPDIIDGVVVDITDQKRLEEDLKQRKVDQALPGLF